MLVPRKAWGIHLGPRGGSPDLSLAGVKVVAGVAIAVLSMIARCTSVTTIWEHWKNKDLTGPGGYVVCYTAKLGGKACTQARDSAFIGVEDEVPFIFQVHSSLVNLKYNGGI